MTKKERNRLLSIHNSLLRANRRITSELVKEEAVLLERIKDGLSGDRPVYEFIKWRSDQAYEAALRAHDEITQLYFLLEEGENGK